MQAIGNPDKRAVKWKGHFNLRIEKEKTSTVSDCAWLPRAAGQFLLRGGQKGEKKFPSRTRESTSNRAAGYAVGGFISCIIIIKCATP